MPVLSPPLQRLDASFDLPTEDGEPLESPQHRIAMTTLKAFCISSILPS